MDNLRYFDIHLEKYVYSAGEAVFGHVTLENVDNMKLRGIRVILRGKAHAEWKIMRSGERRTIKDDQYLLDDQSVIWGKDKHEVEQGISNRDQAAGVLHPGLHRFPFQFNLPQVLLPCSFESKSGTIRYYIKVIVDIPFASPPQGIKYFTIIGPRIDCSDEKYLTPMIGQDEKTVCCLCCRRGLLGLRVTLERTAYVCGEKIRLLAIVENQSDQDACVKMKLMQYVDYFIDKGVLGVNKSLSHVVLEHRSAKIEPRSRGKYDSTLDQPIRLQMIPPTLIGVCRLIQIYYILNACLEFDKSKEVLHMDFPFTVATIPLRTGPSAHNIDVEYDFCSPHVEGGMYVSPEFQLGQVYDGPSCSFGNGCNSPPGPSTSENDVMPLYRPLYTKIPDRKSAVIAKLTKSQQLRSKMVEINANCIEKLSDNSDQIVLCVACDSAKRRGTMI